MGTTAFKMKVEYVPMRDFDGLELRHLVYEFGEPMGQMGEEPVYLVDVERLDEILADQTSNLTPGERQMLEALKQEAEKEGGMLDLSFG